MNTWGRRWTAQEAAGAAIAHKPLPTSGPHQVFKRVSLKAERERLVNGLLYQFKLVGKAGLFQREYRFDATRRWRLDLYCDSHRLGIELHGGIYSGGRHTRGDGFWKDRLKMNAALEAGIRVLEYTPKEIADGSALAQIERVIGAGR